MATTTVFENETRNRFFVSEFTRSAPIISRSALDACDEVNGELQRKLNEMAEATFAVYAEAWGDTSKAATYATATMAFALKDLGFRVIDLQ